MQYIRHDAAGYHLTDYLGYLDGARERFPASARAYALAPWRYDMSHPQCPHDAWLDTLTIAEIPQANPAHRKLELRAVFKGAYHDLYFEMVWQDVQSYALGLASTLRVTVPVAHDDWMIDELLVDESGLLTHEIEFSGTGRWTITCRDLLYTWRKTPDAGPTVLLKQPPD